MLDSPVWRIAAATGETQTEVLAALAVIRDLGYDFDETWELITGALNSGAKLGELALVLDPKE